MILSDYLRKIFRVVSSLIETNLQEQNRDVIKTIKKRKVMIEIFYFAPVNKQFMSVCKKASLLRRINRRVDEALSN